MESKQQPGNSSPKLKVARSCLLLAAILFVMSGMMLCDCWGLCALAAAVAVPSVLWGTRLIRVIGLVVVIASLLAALEAYRVEHRREEHLKSIRKTIKEQGKADESSLQRSTAKTASAEETPSNHPMSLRYVGLAHASDFVPRYHTPTGGPARAFWVTNHTTNILVGRVVLEIKQETNWTVNPRNTNTLGYRLTFCPLDAKGNQPFLAPHSEGYAIPDSSEEWDLPKGTVWRVRAQVQEQLSGIPEKLAAVRVSADFLKFRLRTGNTKLPMHAFGSRTRLFGDPIKVLSDEVIETGNDRVVERSIAPRSKQQPLQKIVGFGTNSFP